MQNVIHPTALVDAKASLGHGNFVGPYCIVGPGACLGNNNRLEAFVSIATAAEHRDYFHRTPGEVIIGNDCVIREYVSVNAGTEHATKVGNGVTILRGSHVGHDAILRDRSTLSCNVLIGGHAIVGEAANLGMGVAVHQRRTIGACSMIGMSSTVTRNIPPFVIAFGTPCELQKINSIGLIRNGLAENELPLFETWLQRMQSGEGSLPPLAHVYQKFIQDFRADCAGDAPAVAA